MPEEQAQAAEQQNEAPPWGSDDQFDPTRAWQLIQDLKADKAKLASRPVITDEQKQQLAEYERLVEASRTDQERQAEELSRWQADAQKWRTTAVASRVQALASDFADPSDAASALDPASYLDAGGQIDDDAIRRDLAALLERKPHWRRPDSTTPRLPAPNRAQGTSGTGTPADPATEFAAILQGQLRR